MNAQKARGADLDTGSLVKRAKALAKSGKDTSSLWYGPDIFTNPLRFICVCEQLRRQKKKFKIYYPKKG